MQPNPAHHEDGPSADRPPPADPQRDEGPDEALIDAFFDDLRLRQLDRCQQHLRDLATHSEARPDLLPWRHYLEGILAFEVERNWSKAEQHFHTLLALDLDQPMRARAVLALGRALDVQGQWSAAITAFEQSASIWGELGEEVEQVKAWKQIALALYSGFSQGYFSYDVLQRANAICQKALDLLERLPDPAADLRWLAGSVWNTLGLVSGCLGQWEAAIAAFERDLAICQQLDDRFGTGLSYGNLGEIYQQQGPGSWPQAIAAYEQALAIIRTFQDRYEEIEALANLAFFHQEAGDCDRAIDYYAQAISIIEELRVGNTGAAARAGFFATVVDIYANMVLLCREAGALDEAFNYVERARSRALLDERDARSSELPADVVATPITLAEVQAALAPDALLVEFFTTGLLEVQEGRTTAVQRRRFPPATTLIFAVTCDSIALHMAPVGPNRLRPARLSNAVERHFLAPATRRTLYAWLIDQVEPLLQGRRQLYLVPHGPLHYIPFQALLAADGAPLLRAEGPHITYGLSATLLFRPRLPIGHAAPLPCLALGYNGSGATRLRFGEEEAHSIAQMTGGHVLAGACAKKAWLFEQAGAYRWLHISCHGLFDPEEPLGSSLRIAPDEELTTLDILQHLRVASELVVLSACESGLSRVRRGDELVGLVRAFLYAGTPALICTLWRVDERSTLLLMLYFYQELQRGAPFAEALQRAQIALRTTTRKQAHDLLLHCFANELLGHRTVSLDGASTPQRARAREEADHYLKGLGTARELAPASAQPAPADDDLLFADPIYWAPFVLICG